VLGLAAKRALELAFEPVEGNETGRGGARLPTLAGGCVAELVDEPREAVDREQVRARVAWQHAAGDREVLAARTRHDRRRGGGVARRVGDQRHPRQRPSAMIGNVSR
jgi:hypothetical protein